MSLIAWFPLNNNKNNIGEETYSISNTPSFSSTGKTANYCGSFSTVSAARTYLTSQTLPLNNNSPISIFCWVYMNSYSTSGANLNGIVSNHDHATNGLGLTLRNNGSSYQVSFSAPVGSTLSSRVFSSIYGATTFTTGSWHHIGVVYNGTDIRLYLDGVEQTIVNNGTNTGKTYFTYTANSGSNNPIGLACWSTSYDAYGSDCKLQDVRVYNHALSNVEIRNLSRALVLHYGFENLYSPVEYLEASGTQYINTGIIDDNTKPVRLEMSVRYSTTSPANQIMGFTGNAGCGIGTDGSKWWEVSNPSSLSANTLYRLEWTKFGSSWTRIINGLTTTGSNANTGVPNSMPMLLFAAWTSIGSSTVNYYCSSKLYYAKIYQNNILVRDFIPVRRTTDGKLGMLDKVNNVFYTNSGSGDFTTSTASISGKVLDCSGNGVDGTTSNISITNDVKIGTQGVTFNGSSSKIDSTILLTTNMTFACWLKFNATGSYHIIDCRATSGETGLQPMYGGTTYGLQCYSSAGGSYTWSAATCGFTTGTWYHLVVAITSSNATLYINGVSKGTQSGTFGSNFGDRLCRLGSRCTGANWFNGAMCDVRVYNTTLSASDIKELYEVRGMIDDKGNAYCDGVASATDFNLSNTGVAKVDLISDGGNKFILGGGYTRLEYIQSSGSQQIDTGLKFDMNNDWCEVDFQATTNNQNGMIFANGNTTNHFWFYHYQDGNGIQLYVQNAGSQLQIGSATRDTNRHTFIWKNKQNIFDGVLKATDTRTLNTTESNIFLFSWGNQYYYQGRIYRCKIWKVGVLTRDFIPVKRNGDNVLGLYDIVNGVFYTNSGSGTFSVGAAIGKLNSIGCNNFYRDGGACVAKYELTQFARYSTYTLSISAGSNTTVTVNRTSSPNAGASTGNLSNGASIYTGDTLTISYSVSSGYNISTHTVNGSTFTSGTSYTVSGNISVITTAVASTTWHTVFSGSQTYNFNANSYGNTTITLSGLRANVSTKITGKVYKDYDLTASGYGSGWAGSPTEYTFSDESTPYTKTGVYRYSPNAKLIQISTPTTTTDSMGVTVIVFPIYRQSGDDSSVVAGCSKLIITKVEQYY